ncbi:MAG: glycosyltransferase [Chloroflexi bacterium]|nr:glycosyltransferase [Chloroflexota bacterium]
MRIGMMADGYKPHISGVTNYIALNKAHLEKMGHEVFVFTFGDENYPDDERNIVRSPGLPLLDTGFYINLRYSQKARQLLGTMDIVHVHHPFLSGSLALRYCRARGIPIVFTNHTRYDLYAQAYLPVLADVIGETTMATYLPVFCRYCDMVIAPSAGMRDVLVHFGVDSPIEVVPNGVDLRPFRQDMNPLHRADFGFTREDVILIYVGRLGPEKNLPFLLRSFAGAYQAFDHIGLLIVGDGPEKEILQDNIHHAHLDERVHFTGLVPYDQLPRYLAMADAFVTASVTEVHPLSVIEAMASSLPVLGIQSPGVGDTVEDGVTGLLAPEVDLAAFTAKMVRLVTQHEQRQFMARSACQAAEKYAIERTTLVMAEHYDHIVKNTNGRKNRFTARLRRVIDTWTL